jgi:hypothetical protein
MYETSIMECSVYRRCSLKRIASELAKYTRNLHPVAVNEVRWDEGGSQPESNYTLFYGSGNANHHLGIGVSYIRELYQHLRG